MKSGVGSNDGKDQSFVQGSVHEDPTIEKDDSKEANLEDNDSHNTDDSYSTDQGNFNGTKMLALETILLKEMK